MTRKISKTEYCTARKRDGHPCEALAKVWLPDGIGFCNRHMPIGWISSGGGELYPDPEFERQLDSEGGPKPELSNGQEPLDYRLMTLHYTVRELKVLLERASDGEDVFWILMDEVTRNAQQHSA